jgi:hypothetical protein
MRERQKLDASINSVTQLTNELTDATQLLEMAEAENDAAMVTDAENSVLALSKRAEQMRLESMLSGEADGNDTYIEIHAGAGGTESQDWASMLLRMYTRWAERHDYKLQLIEESEGEGAGIKSTTLLVKGPNAYGWLKTEAGVHRLVRISFRFQCPAPHIFLVRHGLSGDRPVHRDRHSGKGRARRRLSRLRRGRPACQQDRERGAHHPSSHRHRGGQPVRAQSAPEPRHLLGHAEIQAL